MNVAGTLVTILGLIGLGTAVEAFRRTRTFNRVQRLYRWRYAEPLDVVITTSSLSVLDLGGIARSDRLNAQLGYLKAYAEFSRSVASSHSMKALDVHVSEGIDADLDRDLVLLGGPGGNHLTRQFIAYVNSQWEPGIEFDEEDEHDNRIRLGDVEIHYDWIAEAKERTVEKDFALVVLWINPFAPVKRRAILCSGFTPAGTHAAAHHLINRYPPTRPPQTTGQRWPCFALLLEIQFRNERLFDVAEVARAALPDLADMQDLLEVRVS
ncbi:MAG: hypothetical protein JWR85_1318 [Marmoricola sp.]|nr:hypothetical protein [Marmoricola sp.]